MTVVEIGSCFVQRTKLKSPRLIKSEMIQVGSKWICSNDDLCSFALFCVGSPFLVRTLRMATNIASKSSLSNMEIETLTDRVTGQCTSGKAFL